MDEARALRRLERERPGFMPAPSLGFHLAGVVRSAFFLARERVTEAHRGLVLHAAAQGGDPAWSGVASCGSLAECFADAQVEAIFDPDGNVIDFRQGGDLWAFDLLEPIAHLVRPGSSFLLVDDEERFWKVEFDGGRIAYSKERPQEGWLAVVRDEARLVIETLEGAGWQLEREWMAREKERIERFWGRGAKEEIDPETPVVKLSRRSGPWLAQAEYMGKAIGCWLTFRFGSGSLAGDSNLELTSRVEFPLDAALEAIIEGLDRLPGPHWSEWLGSFRERFQPEVSSASGAFESAKG